MKLKNYVYCALDFSDLNQTLNFTDKIFKHVGGVKVGLEFFVKYGIEGVLKIKNFGIPIFLDLKLHDIPNTVKNTTENILKIQPHLLTIHLTGGSEMIKQVCSIKADTKIIGVTMLTSLDRNDLKACGVEIPESKFVENLTNLGFKSGIDGIVSSPLELTKLKKKFGNSLIYVTPGIRLNENKKNDQKRVSSPGQAVVNGSSLLVIGRPITNSPNPIKSIEEILGNIRESLESRN